MHINDNYLAVIIPTKNEDSTLEELLDCLDGQTISNFRIIVADQSDDDRVEQICKQREIFLTRGGLPGKARNNGAAHTNAEYLLFVDADIQMQSNFIESAISYLQEKNKMGVSFGFIPNTSHPVLLFAHFIAKYYFYIMSNIGVSRGIGGAILVKRIAHESIHGFDETITVAEDHDYLKRLSKSHGYSFCLSLNVYLNTRRFIKFGILKMCLKYFIIEMHRLFIGEIRNDKISYFENHTAEKDFIIKKSKAQILTSEC